MCVYGTVAFRDKQRDRQTDTERGREGERETKRDRQTERDREMNRFDQILSLFSLQLLLAFPCDGWLLLQVSYNYTSSVLEYYWPACLYFRLFILLSWILWLLFSIGPPGSMTGRIVKYYWTEVQYQWCSQAKLRPQQLGHSSFKYNWRYARDFVWLELDEK